MESIWSEKVSIPAREPLPGDMTTEAAVIGAGMAGCLTAYFLHRQGVKTVVLEAGRIAGGQTKNTTAKITSQHGLIYDKLIRTFGEEKARQYAAANQHAIEKYRHLINGNHIDCDFRECPAYLYTNTSHEALRAEQEAASRLGIDAALVEQTELPFPVAGALRFSAQAQFHPLKFLRAITDELTIYEKTPVLRVEGDEEIITDRGTVRAEHIVFASHFPFINAPGFYFLRMHQERSYVLALRNAAQLDGMYLGVDADGLSFRNAGPYLLLGGGSHRTGENEAGGKYERLRQAARELYPQSTEADCWSAQDGIPMDGVPFIGRYAAGKPHWYVAAGFQKWGMTSSMAAAMILCDDIVGKENEFAEVFSPQRFLLSASAKNLATDVKQSVKGLCRGLSDMRCPHLGCGLIWNADEKSWDCPCHGSRFDVDGKLLTGPAQTNAKLRRG
ncbi:MAG: FAD-dependent oxidoreductase [Oscillospiraceae bacterium]